MGNINIKRERNCCTEVRTKAQMTFEDHIVDKVEGQAILLYSYKKSMVKDKIQIIVDKSKNHDKEEEICLLSIFIRERPLSGYGIIQASTHITNTTTTIFFYKIEVEEKIKNFDKESYGTECIN